MIEGDCKLIESVLIMEHLTQHVPRPGQEKAECDGGWSLDLLVSAHYGIIAACVNGSTLQSSPLA